MLPVKKNVLDVSSHLNTQRGGWERPTGMATVVCLSVKSGHGTTPQGFCSQIELRGKEILLNSFLVKQKKNPIMLIPILEKNYLTENIGI